MTSPPPTEAGGSRRLLWILCGSLALTFLYFYGFVPKFAWGNKQATLPWLYDSWNSENKYYEHGWIVATVMGWFIYKAWAPMQAVQPKRGSNMGLLWIVLGVFLWVGGFRAIRGHAAVLSIPCMVMGGVHFVCGWKTARHLMFPLSLFAFMIPVPGIEQATNSLAITATKMAHKFGDLIGIQTIQSGTILLDPETGGSQWKINDGCSGLRSLVALMLISYAYGMVVHKKWWERFVIFAAALPIAMLANGVRITTILIVGKFHRTLASETWHTYSGFFSFGAAFALLMLLSFIMRRGLRALKPKVQVSRMDGPPPSPTPSPAP